MDGYEHHIVVAIDKLDDLLRAIAVGHTHEPGKTAHAMVNMYHIVARLKLREFLERDGHLAAAGLVAAEIVLMKTIEDLMVGEAGHTHRGIGEAPVDSLVHRSEGNIAAALLEDGLQALGLLGAVGEDIELVATVDEVGERLLHQLKVLMEEGLGRGLEGHRGLHRGAGFGTKLDASEGLSLADKVGRVQKRGLPLPLPRRGTWLCDACISPPWEG